MALLTATLVALTGLWAGTTAGAAPPPYDPIRSWNEQALATVRSKVASDAQAARLYAMVNIAIYDAVNGIATADKEHDARSHVLVPATGAPRHANRYAAATSAAYAVLSGEYSDLTATRYEPLRTAEMATLDPGKKTDEGADWGAEVGAAVVSARNNDGSTPNESQAGNPGTGQFRASWSGVQFRYLTPFGIEDSSVYLGEGPPAVGSLDYAGAYANVKIIGNGGLTDQPKLDTFRFWSLGGGTSQPPGGWIQVALSVTEAEPPSLEDGSRLFALVSMAMADTVAPTYMTKYVYHHWRPSTAIREDDGNPLTETDSSWLHRSGGSIGSSPEYWSGHSSFSAAAAEALAGFFGRDRMTFSLVTDSAPKDAALQPIPRTYNSFSEAAAEAGRSREVGGIHFSFSNQDGLAAGRAIAMEILGSEFQLLK